MILAIDPGTALSAYCFCEYESMKPVDFGKVTNAELMTDVLPKINNYAMECIAIEHIQGYGMGVGREVFETCIYIGRLLERIERTMPNVKIQPVYRKDEKLAIVGNLHANDTIIRHRLIDMFAKHDFKSGKGVKAHKDFFFGFKADCWSAFAVAYTARLQMEGKL